MERENGDRDIALSRGDWLWDKILDEESRRSGPHSCSCWRLARPNFICSRQSEYDLTLC